MYKSLILGVIKVTVIYERKLEEITFLNLQKGEVTLMQLNEIYNRFGFVFVGSAGKIKGEIKKYKIKSKNLL